MPGGTLLLLISVLLAVGCNSTTQVKYVHHWAGWKLALPDGTVLTAPANKYYAVFFINCIDNSAREEGFFFTSAKLRDEDGNATQDNPVTDQYVGLTTKLVGAGKIEKKIGKVVFLLPGSPQSLTQYYLSYASDEFDSVLMVSQTVAPLISTNPNNAQNIAEMNSSPFFPEGTECGEAAPHP
jgi:hypothetical protein